MDTFRNQYHEIEAENRRREYEMRQRQRASLTNSPTFSSFAGSLNSNSSTTMALPSPSIDYEQIVDMRGHVTTVAHPRYDQLSAPRQLPPAPRKQTAVDWLRGRVNELCVDIVRESREAA